MNFSARELADILNGKIEGDPDVRVTKISKIEDGVPGSITFLANPLYTQYIYSTKASIIIVNKDFTPETFIAPTLIRVSDSYSTFAKLLDVYQTEKSKLLAKKGISKIAYVSPKAVIGKDVYIGDFAYIGDDVVIEEKVRIYPQAYLGDNVKVKNNTTIYAGVKIYTDCMIGRNCTIHSGAVIGGDGFGFAQQDNLQYMKIAQTGNVVIEDDVEIGSNTTIDRATLGSTIIKKGVKLDNMIQIAHNVVIGENTVIAAQTGVAGSTIIGRNCQIGGQVGIIGHIEIGDNVKITAQSGIGANVPEGSIIQGSPAFEINKYRKSYVHFRNFHEIVSRLEELEKHINSLNTKHKV